MQVRSQSAWLRLGLHFACLVLWSLASVVAGADEEEGWPREIRTDKATIVIYQPQLELFEGNRLQARAAVSVTPKGEDAPVFGAVWFDCRVSTDFDARIVELVDVKVSAVKFPNAQQERMDELARLLETEIPRWQMDIALDRLLTSLEVIGKERTLSEALNNTPPEIIVVYSPSVLVLIDGDPILDKVKNSQLEYVVNTPFFIVRDPSTKSYYLKGGEHWFSAREVTGPWQSIERPPADISVLAEQVATAESQEGAEAVLDSVEVGDAKTPEILVRTKPAELIQINGKPEYTPIEGTELLYLQNTESDVLLHIGSQQYYVLLAGRWFTSKSLTEGPWAFVPSDSLPAEFAKIPPESDMGNVRVSVAGTPEAREAVLENQIPQTAVIDRKEASVTVEYDGEPRFEKIEGTDISYAVNTDKSVLLIDGQYYACDQAVWFVSDRPGGPWEVSTEVPREVQDIPPDNPNYNVKYVYVYDSTPEVVYVGYTPGYYGSYVYGPSVVYGTGWWYRPRPGYYYPRPVTYGFGVHWNPYTGWGFSFGMSVGWLHMSWGRPHYGGWWGPAGYRYGYRHGYHHGYRHGYYRGRRAGFRAGYRAASNRAPRQNIYRARRSGVRSTSRVGSGVRPTRPTVSPNRKNNVYADRQGNVYRRTNKGWERRDGSGWSNKPPSSAAKKPRPTRPSSPDLSREHQARQRGNQRARQYQGARRDGGKRGGRRR